MLELEVGSSCGALHDSFDVGCHPYRMSEAKDVDSSSRKEQEFLNSGAPLIVV